MENKSYLHKVDTLTKQLNTLSLGCSLTIISYKGPLTFHKRLMDNGSPYYLITGSGYYSGSSSAFFAARKAYL